MSGINYETMKQETKKVDLELLAEEMWEVWAAKHKEIYPELYIGSYPLQPKTWDEMDNNIKQCWITAARHAIGEDEYTS